MKHIRHRRRSLTGFTLIELIVVISIIGFLTVAIITSYVDPINLRIDGAARKIQSDVRYAHLLAFSEQRRHRLVFDAANESYVVEREDTMDAEDWTSIIDPVTRTSPFQVAFNTGEYVDVFIIAVNLGTGDVLIFDEFGAPFTNGNVPLAEPANVVLTGSKQVQFTPRTGRAVIV